MIVALPGLFSHLFSIKFVFVGFCGCLLRRSCLLSYCRFHWVLVSCPTDRSKAVSLLQFFFLSSCVCGFIYDVCVVLICSSSLLRLVPREGCASFLWHFLGTFTYILIITSLHNKDPSSRERGRSGDTRNAAEKWPSNTGRCP